MYASSYVIFVHQVSTLGFVFWVVHFQQLRIPAYRFFRLSYRIVLCLSSYAIVLQCLLLFNTVRFSLQGLHVIAGNTGGDAVQAAKRDHILTMEGSMTPNFHPYADTRSSPLMSNTQEISKKTGGALFSPKTNRKAPSLFNVFQKSRQALVDGDTGMAQTFLTYAADDRSYGQTQYALDLIFVFATARIGIRMNSGYSSRARPEQGRMGRLTHLKSMLTFPQPVEPWHHLHSRNVFNSLTGW